MSFAYHLVFVDKLRTSLSVDEVEATIWTSTTLATDSRDDVACGVEGDSIARELLNTTDEMCLCDGGATASNGVGEDDKVST